MNYSHTKTYGKAIVLIWQKLKIKWITVHIDSETTKDVKNRKFNDFNFSWPTEVSSSSEEYQTTPV